MTEEIHRCYGALELKAGASLEQVKQAYRDLVKVWHPDRFPNDAKLQRKAQERLKQINLAYERLEGFLTTHTPPPRSGPASSHSSEPRQEQNRESPWTRSGRAETPPPPPPPPPPPQSSNTQAPREPAKSRAGVLWGVAAIVVVVILVLVNSGRNTNRSQSFSFGSYDVPSGRGGSGVAQAPVFIPPVSKALDEKNGFKDFKFGMTPEEVRGVLAPSQTTDEPGANVEVFHYRASAANLVGDFATELLRLTFFEGHLYQIDLEFSKFGNEIFEALRVNYGESYDSENWTRGDETWRAKSWLGDRIVASIMARATSVWESVVIYDMDVNRKAQDYAEKEPARAAKDFGPAGFKFLVMGMTLRDVTNEFVVLKEDKVAGVKEVTFTRGDWRAVGFYPLRSVSAEFFKDRLYRISLGFEENRKEMFEVFRQRFGPLQDDDSWTRGTAKLKGKSATKDKLFEAILAPHSYLGRAEQWDAMVLCDVDLWREAEQFKQDAPKRAAKDF